MKGIKKMGRPPAKDPISYSIKIGLNKELYEVLNLIINGLPSILLIG